MADRYGFTTTSEDNYLYRLQDETPDSARFVLVTDSSTVEDSVSLFLFINKELFDRLAEEFPNERLLGEELGEFAFHQALGGQLMESLDGRFYVAAFFGLDRERAKKEALAVKNEIKRLQNMIDGRTVRVTVESF